MVLYSHMSVGAWVAVVSAAACMAAWMGAAMVHNRVRRMGFIIVGGVGGLNSVGLSGQTVAVAMGLAPGVILGIGGVAPKGGGAASWAVAFLVSVTGEGFGDGVAEEE